MQLTIYGSLEAGRITVNADGLRVVLTKTEAGWAPSSADAMSAICKTVSRELSELMTTLAGETDGGTDHLRLVKS